jgi:hypothetical protein
MDAPSLLRLRPPTGRPHTQQSRSCLPEAVLALAALSGHLVPAGTLEAGALPERTQEAIEAIQRSPLDGEPIRLESDQEDDAVMVRIDAILDHSFQRVAQEFRSPMAWCESLFLHLIVKACVHHGAADRSGIELYIGRKRFQRPENAYRMELDFRVQAADEDYLAVELEGARGPYGIRNYHMTLEAVPLDRDRTLIHVRHSVDHGALAGAVLNVYLRFTGGDRIGFTMVGEDDAGRPIYINGRQGVIERNVMRFYLAVQAYLESLEAPEDERLEAHMVRWFELTERYPEQLRDLNQDSYLRQKALEWSEQQALQADWDARH